MNNVVSINEKNKFSGDALKKARLLKGKTTSELSESLSVSQQMLSKYEKEQSVPSFEILKELSSVLEFPISYFYTDQSLSDISEGFYRKGSNLPKKNKYKVSEKLSFINEIIGELSKVVSLPKYQDPIEVNRKIKFEELSLDYIESIANSIREKFNLGNGPLLNLTGFLESLGIIVVFLNLDSEKIDAYTVVPKDGRPIILINSQRTSSSRIRFNLAHEFAHILFHKDYLKKYENGSKYSIIEKEANFFAGCFLVPEQGLLEDMSSVNLQHFIVLKDHWHVSIAALIYRANQCGFISNNHTLHLRQQISRNGWRKKEPLDETIKIEDPQMISQAVDIYSSAVNGDAVEHIARKLKMFPSFVYSLICQDKQDDDSKISMLKLL